MAISYIAAGASTFTSTGATLSVAVPAGITLGDFMMIVVGTVDRIPTTPSGWTLLGNNLIQSSSVRQSGWIYYKIAGASEGAVSLASTQDSTGTGKNVEAKMYIWRGVATATPIDASIQWAALSNTTTIATPAITTVTANAEIVFVGFDQIGNTWTAPGGVTIRNFTAISGYAFMIADEPVASPGTIGSANFTSIGTGASRRIAGFALQPLSTTSIKTVEGLAYASVKTVSGLAVASVKTIEGLA